MRTGDVTAIKFGMRHFVRINTRSLIDLTVAKLDVPFFTPYDPRRMAKCATTAREHVTQQLSVCWTESSQGRQRHRNALFQAATSRGRVTLLRAAEGLLEHEGGASGRRGAPQHVLTLQLILGMDQTLSSPYRWSMTPAFAGQAFSEKPIPTPDQVRGRLFRDHALKGEE